MKAVMSVGASGGIALNAAAPTVSVAPQLISPSGALSKTTGFSAILQQLSSKDLLGNGLKQQIVAMTDKLAKSKKIDPHDLIVLQNRSHELGLRMELVSKVIESGVTSLRKLQSQQ